MPKHAVVKTLEYISKDPDTGILISVVMYETTALSNTISFIIKYPEMAPDNFEIECDESCNVSSIVEIIKFNVSTLKISQPINGTCPLCQKNIYYKDDKLACFNMNCRSIENSYNTLRRQLNVVFNIDNHLIEYLLVDTNNHKQPITLVNILKRLMSRRRRLSNVPEDYHTGIVSSVNFIRNNISISQFFRACSIFDIVGELELITTLYDDLITNAVIDKMNNYTNLLELPVMDKDRAMFDSVLSSNIDVFEACGICK